MADKEKFKFGDIPTTTLQLGWTIREADLARDAADDPARPLYWPPRPPMPPGQEFTAPTEWAVLTALLLFVGEPKDGNFTCRPKVATIARITGLDASTVRRYLKCLRERGVIKWRPWGTARLFTFNIAKLALAAKLAVAAYAEVKDTRSKAEEAEDARIEKLWSLDLDDAESAAPDTAAAQVAIVDEDEDEDEDITARSARLDAECEAATGGDCIMLVTAAAAPLRKAEYDEPGADEEAGDEEEACDEDDWRKDTEYVDQQTEYVRDLYDLLQRKDMPTDPIPAIEAFMELLGRVDVDEYKRVINFVLDNEDPFWRTGMTKPGKKHGNCPFRYLDANFAKIQAQADAAAAKVAKKAAKPAIPANVAFGKYTSGKYKDCDYDPDDFTPGTERYSQLHQFCCNPGDRPDDSPCDCEARSAE
jgi:hypothetical protein